MKSIHLILILGACLGICCAANAAPVHYDCVIPKGDFSEESRYRISVDEEAKLAVFSLGAQGSPSQTIPARFTSRDISFIAVMPEAELRVEYRIVRDTLKFSRMVRSGSLRHQYGTCTVNGAGTPSSGMPGS
jgi:hypothetical protein